MASTFCIDCGDLRISPKSGTLASCRVDARHAMPVVIPETVAAKLGEMGHAARFKQRD